MSESDGKCGKRYVNHSKDRSKLTCVIHGPGNSSDECKVLGDFGYKYSKRITTKNHRQEPATKNKFGMHQDNNAIVKHAVHEIILQENIKLSVKYETHENIYS